MLVHADFVPVLEQIKDELKGVRKVVVLADGQAVAGEHAAGRGRVRGARRRRLARLRVPRLRREHQGGDLLHDRHDRRSEGRVLQPPPDRPAHAGDGDELVRADATGQRIHREDVYMPITPMFHVLAWGLPYVAVMLGLKTVLPGRYLPGRPARSCSSRRRSPSRIACRPSCRCCCRRPRHGEAGPRRAGR